MAKLKEANEKNSKLRHENDLSRKLGDAQETSPSSHRRNTEIREVADAYTYSSKFKSSMEENTNLTTTARGLDLDYSDQTDNEQTDVRNVAENIINTDNRIYSYREYHKEQTPEQTYKEQIQRTDNVQYNDEYTEIEITNIKEEKLKVDEKRKSEFTEGKNSFEEKLSKKTDKFTSSEEQIKQVNEEKDIFKREEQLNEQQNISTYRRPREVTKENIKEKQLESKAEDDRFNVREQKLRENNKTIERAERLEARN